MEGKWRGRRVAVVGLGISNRALVRHLVREGARVVGLDRKDEAGLGPQADVLRSLGVSLVLGPGYLAALGDDYDAVFLSPGMPKHVPEIADLRRRGVPLSSEAQLSLELCPARTVGITGSSGKTTTTTLTGECLRAAGLPVVVAGNIGTPLIEHLDRLTPEHWVVLELSSFQLETMAKSPQVALVTNITPNHLDVHESMEAYVDAKRRIYRFQGEDDWAVFNGRDPKTREMAAEAPARAGLFGGEGEDPRPRLAFLEGDQIYVHPPGAGPEPVCGRSEILLRGSHNLENVLAAVSLAGLCGVPVAAQARAVRAFRGVRHRLELVAEAGGVRFFNDSIATTPARAAAGLRAFEEPVILIAGGYDKGLAFDELAEAAEGRVRLLVVVGATAGRIEQAVAGRGVAVRAAPSFEEAVEAAVRAARPGEVVLLSPGCASYDMFRNYEERGERFRELVQQLAGSGHEALPAH